jgi:hypothetical protein
LYDPLRASVREPKRVHKFNEHLARGCSGGSSGSARALPGIEILNQLLHESLAIRTFAVTEFGNAFAMDQPLKPLALNVRS